MTSRQLSLKLKTRPWAGAEARPYDRFARLIGRRGLPENDTAVVVKFLGPLLLALFFAACGSALQPKQARFELSGCEAIADAFDPASVDWQMHPDPVLEQGPAGAWDDADVLNPSVVRVDKTFYNLYSGFDGDTWHTGVATSQDGVVWEKSSANPVLSPDPATWEGGYIAANGAAYHDGNEFLYWYHAGPRNAAQIGLASSRDGLEWQKHPRPVLTTGAPGAWDETAVADPYVIRCGDNYYMYFLGQNRFGLQRLGVARSEDGLHWQKSHANPILDTGPPDSFDANGLGEPAVFYAGGSYWMLYTGRDLGEKRRTGWAQSANGVDWEKKPAPLLEGSQPWNQHVVCDPTVWAEGGRLLVWFGGGNQPSPDENLSGKIGLATIEIQPQAAKE